MKNNNSGYIKITLLILSVLIGLTLIYFFVFKNTSKLQINSKVEAHPNAVVIIDNNKLYRFDFDNLKKDAFEDAENIGLRSKFVFNKNRDTFAVINLPENFDYEKNYLNKVIASFYNRDTLKKISEIEVSVIYGNVPGLMISPDGQKFSLVESVYFKEKLGKNIKIFDITGKQLDEIKNDGTREYKLLSWSPNSDKILFNSNTLLEIEPENEFDKLDSKLKIYNTYTKTISEIKPQDGVSKEYFRDWRGRAMDVDWYEDDKFSFLSDVSYENQSKYNYSLLSNTASKDDEYVVTKNALPNLQYDNGSTWSFARNKSFIIFQINKDQNPSIAIHDIENKKTALLKELNKYPNAALEEGNIFWLNDNKSVVMGIHLACGLEECEKGSESIIGVYKVNVDGTNWKKINEIPNLKILERGINYWY